MAIISASWADALDPIIHHWFEQGVNRRTSLIPMLYNVQNSMRAYEEVSSVGAIGTEAWDTYRLSGQVGNVDFDQGYKKTYTHEEYVVELEIERKFLDDNNYRQITDPALRLGDSAAVKREVDAASVFNNAFTASAPYLGSDAVALCSASHPKSPQKADVQTNTFALALTKDNVATVREAMMAFTDDAENIVAVTPNMLLVPPELEDEAMVIAGSLLDPGSANNAINPHSNRFTVLTWHYLTDNNAWFMIDTNMMKMGLDWFNRDPLTLVYEGMYKQVRASWTARMRYVWGFSDWRWVAGSNPS